MIPLIPLVALRLVLYLIAAYLLFSIGINERRRDVKFLRFTIASLMIASFSLAFLEGILQSMFWGEIIRNYILPILLFILVIVLVKALWRLGAGQRK